MRFRNYIKYNNWIRFSNDSLNSDWAEFKKKEEKKWKSRAKMLNARWPLFNSIKHFKESLENAKIVKGTDSFFNKVEHATSIYNLKELESIVHSYHRPRDINRIVKGYENNDKIPMPIVLKSGNRYFIMAGNTRQNSARILGITPEVLVIDVDKNER